MIHNKQTPSDGQIQVWDIGVRLFHWSLVAGVIMTYFLIDPRAVHRILGYIVIGLVGFRFVWGLVGPQHARFVNFVPGPVTLLNYLRDMLRAQEQRYLGHNPAGGAMIVLLIFTLCAVGVSGYMMGMDAFFGRDWVETLHELFVNLLLVLVGCHIGGVIYASWRHHENLAKAMMTGKKDVHVSDRNAA